MLPKIIVAGAYERDVVLSFLGLTPATTMGYEGNEGKIDDLRHFINFGVNVSAGSPVFSLVIWNADRLSQECQTVLLKPLEDSSEGMSLLLVVTNENSLLPTILSRCLVINQPAVEAVAGSNWKKVTECFAKGPAKCLDWAGDLEKPEMERTLEEVITKLKLGLSDEVNKNRLDILKLAIDCLALIRFTNVNAKLAFGNFLISSWRLIKK